MPDKKEIILIEIPDRDYGAVTFVTRYVGFPNASNERIQQRAWGVLPEACGDPRIFPIYSEAIGFHKQGNNELLRLPHGGRLEDYADTFEGAVKKAYEFAKRWVDSSRDKNPEAEFIEYTRVTGRVPLQNNKDHWFWFQD